MQGGGSGVALPGLCSAGSGVALPWALQRRLRTYDEYKNLISLDDEDSSKAYVSKIERSEYDKDFFEKNSLALAFKSYHPSDALAAVNLLHTGAHLNIMTTIQYASGEEAMTDEISGFIVLVEVGKDVEEVSIY